MALPVRLQEAILHAHADSEFRTRLLKVLVKMAVKADPDLLNKALDQIEQKQK